MSERPIKQQPLTIVKSITFSARSSGVKSSTIVEKPPALKLCTDTADDLHSNSTTNVLEPSKHKNGMAAKNNLTETNKTNNNTLVGLSAHNNGITQKDQSVVDEEAKPEISAKTLQPEDSSTNEKIVKQEKLITEVEAEKTENAELNTPKTENGEVIKNCTKINSKVVEVVAEDDVNNQTGVNKNQNGVTVIEPKETEPVENDKKEPESTNNKKKEDKLAVLEEECVLVHTNLLEKPKDPEPAVKRGLPKWMAEDANAPPEEEEIVNEVKNAGDVNLLPADVSVAVEKGRGRGRARKQAVAAPATTLLSTPSKRVSRELQSLGCAGSSKIEGAAVEDENGRPQRPRRSTRTRIDYANPDAATVIAEVDDEEPDSLEIVKRGSRGRAAGVGAGRGRKRGTTAIVATKQKKQKTANLSDNDDEDDDASSDYSSSMKKKVAKSSAKSLAKVATSKKGRRGRQPAKGKETTKGRQSTGRNAKRGAKKYNDDSEEDDGELEIDDAESNKEESSVEENDILELPIPKLPPKKRGRISAVKSKENGAAAENSKTTDQTVEINA